MGQLFTGRVGVGAGTVGAGADGAGADGAGADGAGSVGAGADGAGSVGAGAKEGARVFMLISASNNLFQNLLSSFSSMAEILAAPCFTLTSLL